MNMELTKLISVMYNIKMTENFRDWINKINFVMILCEQIIFYIKSWHGIFI